MRKAVLRWISYNAFQRWKSIFNNLPGAKGVDFLAVGKKDVLFLEVKDCVGAESDNRWRIFPNNRKRDASPTAVDTACRDSLDSENWRYFRFQLAIICINCITNINDFKQQLD